MFNIPADAKAKYIERRKADLSVCRKALEEGNFKQLAHVGHQVKGNAGTFGFDQLSEIAAQLEDEATAENKDGVEDALKKFENFILKIK
jgi:HPt (histidine-containing phosphotransfer) domain-containing protein